RPVRRAEGLRARPGDQPADGLRVPRHQPRGRRALRVDRPARPAEHADGVTNLPELPLETPAQVALRRRALIPPLRFRGGVVVAGAIVGAIVVVAIFASLLAPHDPNQIDLLHALRGRRPGIRWGRTARAATSSRAS